MKKKTGYKLFEMRDDGKCFPLFIDKTKETPINEWVSAKIVNEHKGFAHRPGWHIGELLPSAPWLMSANGFYNSQRGKKFKRVWCVVEYSADFDYTEEALSQPKQYFTDRLPSNGFYKYKEGSNRLWIIADQIKIVKILTEEERQDILRKAHYDELEAFEPYRRAFEKRKNSVR